MSQAGMTQPTAILRDAMRSIASRRMLCGDAIPGNRPAR